MGRVFNTTGVCIPEKHYMVNINGRLQQIRELVDAGKYFTINRAMNNPVPVSLLSGDRKPQIRFLGNHPSGSGNLYHKSFRM